MTGKARGKDRWAGRRVLVATSEPAHPVATGGIQASAHDLLFGLGGVLGADARLLSAARPGDSARCERRLEQLGVHCARDQGELHYQPGPYRAVLTSAPAFLHRFDDLVHRWQPEVIVAQAAGWRDVVFRSRAAGTLAVHWMHGWLGLLGDEAIPKADLLLANSEYTAEQVVERFGLRSTVFHPPIDPERVRAARAAGPEGAITMINPHPAKGIDLFLGLARRFRRHRFLAVDCWGTAPYIERAIRREPNVDHLPAHSDMSAVYGQTALLIVPTTGDETFGRVVVEAQLSGIPVLASDRGALPNVVGCGGQVLSPDAPLERWAHALETLIHPADYPRWSEAARLNATRFDFEEAILRFARVVDAVHGASP